MRSYAGIAQLTFRGGLRFQVALHRILVRLSRILLCFKANGMGINSGKFEDDRKKQRQRKSSLVAKKNLKSSDFSVWNPFLCVSGFADIAKLR